MFPTCTQLSTVIAHDLDHQRANRPANRLDVFRHKLESEKVQHHLYTLEATQQADRETLQRELERRRVMNEHRNDAHSPFPTVRRALGRILISAGERIRPETA